MLQDIYDSLQTLVSTSHNQQQDLNAIKDDLGSLKFGFALLQDTTTELKADSTRQKYQLMKLQSKLQAQSGKIDDLGECLAEHKTDSTERLDSLQTTVDTSQHPCGGEDDWIQVVDFDMTDADTNCPTGWEESMFDLRTCGRTDRERQSCYPATFTFSQGMLSFSKICGRVKAYAYGAVDGFQNFIRGNKDIDDPYVSGVSLTADVEGDTQHLWTFAAGIGELGRTSRPFEPRPDQCPCDLYDSTYIPIPFFVGNNYFCESGLNIFVEGKFVFQADDPLWDGKNCNPESGCCYFNKPPYFMNNLGNAITIHAIDARICLLGRGPADIGDRGDDILVEAIEIYVAP